MLFHDNAIRAPGLKSMEDLRRCSSQTLHLYEKILVKMTRRKGLPIPDFAM